MRTLTTYRARLFRQGGFTLIELLVVILIIGILIAVSAPSFLGQIGKAHDSASKQYLAYAYRAAKADAVDREGSFGTAADVAQAITSSEPELTSGLGTCPASANADPKHIVVDVNDTGGENLTICNDPNHTVWTLKVVGLGAPQFSSDLDQPVGDGGTSSDNGGGGNGGGGNNNAPVPLSGDALNNAPGAPANDDFANAQVLGDSGTLNGTLAGATVQLSSNPPEEDPTNSNSDTYGSKFVGENPDASVWYEWTAPTSDTYYFTTVGSPAPFDGSNGDVGPTLNVADLNGIGDWTQQDGNWQNFVTTYGVSVWDPTAIASFPAQADHTYIIRVANSSYDVSSGNPITPYQGAFKLTWGLDTRPVVADQPTLSGTAAYGQTLTASHGSWTNSPTNYSYQWLLCDTNGQNCSDTGHTGATYVVSSSINYDDLKSVVVKVTASNDGTFPGVADSYGLMVNDPNGPPRVRYTTNDPAASGGFTGSLQVGQTIGFAPPALDGAQPITMANYQWNKCQGGFSNCSYGFSSASSQTLTSGDSGYMFQVCAQARNSAAPGGDSFSYVCSNWSDLVP